MPAAGGPSLPRRRAARKRRNRDWGLGIGDWFLKLIVGLGNPGPEYTETRHNIGFKVAEEIARRHRVTFKTASKWKARTARIAEGDDDLMLAEPTTFMNLSGWAVQAIMSFHKIESSDLLVVVDDAD